MGEAERESATARQDSVELQRLARLHGLNLLDTAPAAVFDTLARIASSVCGTPIALITLVDSQRQWFKANVGLPGVAETPRDVSFCTRAIEHEGLFEVQDARRDERFAESPLVTGAPHIRFYAGMPLRLPDGHQLGTLCVIDRQTRLLTEHQQSVLRDLARAVVEAILLHERTLETATAQAAQRLAEQHAQELARLLQERSDMLDVLAHEVRQPLNNASAALQSAVAVLADKGEAEASARLARAQTVLNRVQSGVDNTLTEAALLGGFEAVTRHETDVDTLVALAIADMPLIERGRVVVHREAACRSVAMDMGLMRLALRNLISNALKFSAAGTPVGVTLFDVDEPPGLVIEVSDAGLGVEAAVEPRLFTRGARGRRPSGAPSHGLGLYIAHRILELHGGRLSLARNSSLGATFRISLPDQAVD